ncbi:DUF3592 domain-containing protein [Corynebacterium zhongnanshanii]|uniref:DUF3592 domain-containing protein n=1 Tax=Corynebacterium zhongnanshanii TaxID=2768834 RepID=UPI0018658213|nr:DUF3592 domain-containing protein [Corynebacterium zhongnanshanii]
MTPRQEIVLRRINQVALALSIFVVLVCGGMVATSAMDDARISSQRGTSIATVLNVGTLRTTVRFPDAEGNYHQPEVGLKYPVGLVEGQRVRVDYQIGDPENVKVQGRSWTLAFLPAGTSMAALLAIVLGLRWAVTWSLRKYAWGLTGRTSARDLKESH